MSSAPITTNPPKTPLQQWLVAMWRSAFIQQLFNTFQSVPLAIVLISLLALGTLVGVLMPQEGTIDPTEVQAKLGINYQFFKTIGFVNVYSSFWFITLEVLFFFNLLIGSFKWLKPAILAATQNSTFSPEILSQKPLALSLPQLSFGTPKTQQTKLQSLLAQHGFKLRNCQYNEASQSISLYASKGDYTRFGPAVAHIGILLCLMAGVYGAFTGFKALNAVTPGAPAFSISEAEIFTPNTPSPFWQGSIPNWQIKVHDFQISFHEQKRSIPKQFTSNIELIAPDGKSLIRQDISVNHPLTYKDVTIYQANYAPTGQFYVKINNQPSTLMLNDKFNQRSVSINPLGNGKLLLMFPFFASQDGVEEDHAIFMVRDPKQKMGNGKMPPNTKLRPEQRATIDGVKIEYFGPQYFTGFQIKKAPEVPLMYFSFLLISLGTAMCFFSQRQLWVAIRPVGNEKAEIIMAAKTNKGHFSYQKELHQLRQLLL